MSAATPTYSLALRGQRWYVAWWENGKSQRISCRTSDQTQARRFLAEFLAGLNATPIPETPTIGKVLDGYLAARPEAHSLDTFALFLHQPETASR
jgi:hypothetical protein